VHLLSGNARSIRTGDRRTGGLLIGINPDDIEPIKALKDPADLSLYGMRGANGVK
jgi:TonB-dependent SusC/RagA subfamily outer membrane receptor